MPVSLNHHEDLGHLEVLLTGKVTRQDHETNGPLIEELIKRHGKLRLLVELRDFKGWTFGGLWEDIKFDVKHFRNVERLAIVGEKRWHEAMALFCKPFSTAKVRYFESFEIAEARQWLTEERSDETTPAEAATAADVS